MPLNVSFHELIKTECDFLKARIDKAPANEKTETSDATPADDAPGVPDVYFGDEPRVSFCPHDRVGLALSGGGIRSATFNLGLLQGLEKYDILGMVDYLSTVSGGGYVGGWWMAWRRRQLAAGKGRASVFPKREESTAGEAEVAEVRHLREFSRFLSPRVGLFDTEMWNAIVAYLNGAIPTTLISIALAWLAWGAFLGATFLALRAGFWSAGFVTVAFIGLQCVFERSWRKGNRGESATCCGRLGTNLATILILWCLYWYCLGHCFDDVRAQIDTAEEFVKFAVEGPKSQPLAEECASLRCLLVKLGEICETFRGFATCAAEKQEVPPLFTVWVRVLLFPPLFGFAFAFLLTCLRWLVRPLARFDRTLEAQWNRRALAAYHDRYVGRTLLFALAWLVVGVLWLVACTIYGASTRTGIGSAFTVWLVSSGLFTKLRNWLFQSLRPGQQAGWLESFKPLVPTALAYLALVSGLVLACLLLLATSQEYVALIRRITTRIPSHAEASAVVVLVTTVFGALLLAAFDLRRMGLHMFYRRKISRAFLGASNFDRELLKELSCSGDAAQAKAAKITAKCNGEVRKDNRQTDELQDDDFSLCDLPMRPLHLICCAANTLGMDALATLNRGARSFVASRCGLSMGNGRRDSVNLEDVTYGNFLTASAAAFNSNMGSVSVQLGPAAAVLMTLANLRLGLWAANPLSGDASSAGRASGWKLLDEMFRRTKTNGPLVHLSDGGHFENLALYELVRRHCRYVILSDCGADPETAFDDLGNALRRIREDFGVEIEIDVEPLRPRADQGRLAAQHVVVGTIHYDGIEGLDKGLLIYFKPNLTGDEPADIVQYHARNPIFPNESTIDQFYDEAQWESYRRLGEHAAHSAFRFLERPSQADGTSREKHDVFPQMRWQWYPTPPDLERNVVEQAQQLDGLLNGLQNSPFGRLRGDIFPELQQFGGFSDPQETLIFLSRMLQLMENAWNRCRLETLENHPLNNGWVNQFARWAAAPVFRRWWPFLKPLYSDGLVEFVEQRLGVAPGPNYFPVEWKTRIKRFDALPADLKTQWRIQDRPRNSTKGPVYWYQYEVDVPVGDKQVKTLPVVLLAAEYSESRKQLSWRWDDLYLPPGLAGAGLGTEFLRELRDKLQETKDGNLNSLGRPRQLVESLLVRLDNSEPDPSQEEKDPSKQQPKKRDGSKAQVRTDAASRNRRIDELMVYKRLGFRGTKPITGEEPQAARLSYRLKPRSLKESPEGA